MLVIDRHDEGKFAGRIALNAVSQGTMTPESFANGSAQAQVNADPTKREMVHNAFAVKYAGKQFSRADYKQPLSKGSQLYIAFVYTAFRGYLIGETVMADSPKSLDDAVDSLQRISFQEDLPNLKCVAGSTAVPGSGVIGGRISSAPTGAPTRVRISQSVSQAFLITKVQPQYPESARKGRIQGDVLLKTIIDSDGNVAEVTLISGQPELVPAAIDAVRQWKYTPYKLDGKSVTVETQVTVRFELSEN